MPLNQIYIGAEFTNSDGFKIKVVNIKVYLTGSNVDTRITYSYEKGITKGQEENSVDFFRKHINV